MSPPGSPRLVDSFTAPKEVLQEFADLAEEENVDPFAETASKRQIASRQTDSQLVQMGTIGGEVDITEIVPVRLTRTSACMSIAKTPSRRANLPTQRPDTR